MKEPHEIRPYGLSHTARAIQGDLEGAAPTDTATLVVEDVHQ